MGNELLDDDKQLDGVLRSAAMRGCVDMWNLVAKVATERPKLLTRMLVRNVEIGRSCFQKFGRLSLVSLFWLLSLAQENFDLG